MMNSLAPRHTENNRPRAVPPFRRIPPRKKLRKKSARKKIDVGIRGLICESHSQSFAQCANNVYFFSLFFLDSARDFTEKEGLLVSCEKKGLLCGKSIKAL